MIKVKRYGWRPARPDKNRKKFIWNFPRLLLPRDFPASVDLQPHCPWVYDQGDLGSCTANAGGALAHFLLKKLHPAHSYMPARLPIYYWEREIEGTINEDSGASLADVMKVITTHGVPHETMFPYDIANFTHKPSMEVCKDGWHHKVTEALSLDQDINQFKSCLAAGYPFVFGFSVYDSFEQGTWDKDTGMMPMPKKDEQVVGGHAVMAVGYDDEKQAFKIRNSWGTEWGQGGYFWMPYTFILDPDYASDFWCAHFVWG